MPVRHNALLNSYTFSASGTFDQNQEMPRGLRSSVTSIVAEVVTGAPTSVILTPKFHFWHSMVGGNQEEANTGGSGISPDKTWFPITAANNPSMLPDGDWPASFDVTAATLIAPLATFRSLKGGFPWKLVCGVAITGGTAPTVKLSVMTYFDEYPAIGLARGEDSMF